MKRNLLIVLVFVLSPLFRANSQNLFTDPSFDSGTKDAWVTWGSDANVLQSFDVLDDGTGNFVAKLVVANAVNDINDGTFKQKNTITSLDSSMVYHLSVRAKAENVTSGETAQLIFKTQRLKDGTSVKSTFKFRVKCF